MIQSRVITLGKIKISITPKISFETSLFTYRYVDIPATKLREIMKTNGKMPKVVNGEIIAGDAVELSVLENLEPFTNLRGLLGNR